LIWLTAPVVVAVVVAAAAAVVVVAPISISIDEFHLCSIY